MCKLDNLCVDDREYTVFCMHFLLVLSKNFQHSCHSYFTGVCISDVKRNEGA